jgi:hypothetical protein
VNAIMGVRLADLADQDQQFEQLAWLDARGLLTPREAAALLVVVVERKINDGDVAKITYVHW